MTRAGPVGEPLWQVWTTSKPLADDLTQSLVAPWQSR
jgi:hypothetical protein